jgi:hypothetical protein
MLESKDQYKTIAARGILDLTFAWRVRGRRVANVKSTPLAARYSGGNDTAKATTEPRAAAASGNSLFLQRNGGLAASNENARGFPMPALIRRILHLHWLVTLFLMGMFAMTFGLLSLNLFMILRANVNLIAAHGAMALMDGAFVQLLGLIGYGYLGVIAFLLFKACEKVLVERLLR